jgi:hypothetical protein
VRLLEGKKHVDDTSDRLGNINFKLFPCHSLSLSLSLSEKLMLTLVADMQRIGFETEEIGAKAMEGLATQRTQLETAHTDVSFPLLTFILPT